MITFLKLNLLVSYSYSPQALHTVSVWLVFGWAGSALHEQCPTGSRWGIFYSSARLIISCLYVLCGMDARDAEDVGESTGKRPHQAPFSSAMESNVKSNLVDL